MHVALWLLALTAVACTGEPVGVDDTHVYWLSRGTQGLQKCAQHDGRVMRAKKPW